MCLAPSWKLKSAFQYNSFFLPIICWFLNRFQRNERFQLKRRVWDINDNRQWHFIEGVPLPFKRAIEISSMRQREFSWEFQFFSGFLMSFPKSKISVWMQNWLLSKSRGSHCECHNCTLSKCWEFPSPFPSLLEGDSRKKFQCYCFLRLYGR